MKGCIRWIGYIVGGLVILAVAAVAVIALIPSDSKSASSPVDPNSTPTPQPIVGSFVTVDEIRWRVTVVENLGNTLSTDNQFVDDEVTSGAFIRVGFEVENNSKEMLTYAGLDLYDSEGRAFTNYSGMYSFLDDDEECGPLGNINPGLSRTCVTIFEVPLNAQNLQLEVTDLQMFGGESKRIDLGLSASE